MAGSIVNISHPDNTDYLYTTKVGLIFRKSLAITTDGIQWKNRFIRFNDIVATGWGGMLHIYNFIPTGTTYYISLQDDRDNYPVCITTRRKSVYKKIVKHVWDYSCSRIAISLLVGLQHGKRYRFASAVIDDQGVYLSHKRWLKSPEMFYFTWDAVDLWSSNGHLFIGQRNGIYHQLPYSTCDNAHILETMVSAAIQKGYRNLSQLLH